MQPSPLAGPLLVQPPTPLCDTLGKSRKPVHFVVEFASFSSMEVFGAPRAGGMGRGLSYAYKQSTTLVQRSRLWLYTRSFARPTPSCSWYFARQLIRPSWIAGTVLVFEKKTGDIDSKILAFTAKTPAAYDMLSRFPKGVM
jgi:hypothetical protein